MPRKPWSLMNCQTFGGRSFSSCVICQSSSIAHTSSTGPSTNAFSSAESVGLGNASIFFQSGLPLKRSPSHHTVPASSASCSVCDICGRILRNNPSSGAPSTLRRSTVGTDSSATTMKIAHSVEFTAGDIAIFEVKSHSHTPMATAHSHALAR